MLTNENSTNVCYDGNLEKRKKEIERLKEKFSLELNSTEIVYTGSTPIFDLGIGFPGGPKVELLALQGKNYIELPYRVKGMDITISGILTNLRQKIERMKMSGRNLTIKNSLWGGRAGDWRRNNYTPEDLAFSAQETIFAMLVEISERALAHVGKKELLLGGGVACNSRLQKMCEIMCRERKAKFFVPKNQFLVDNGAMIAFLGEIMFKSGIKFSEKKAQNLRIKPKQRTDEVEVSWKK